jgi:hypothetical protein
MPLPQSEGGDADNILVKAEGNSLRITVQWDLIKESSTVVTRNAGAPTLALDDAIYTDGLVKHPDEMVRFLTDIFQNKGVEYQWEITIPKSEGVLQDIKRNGLIEKISISKSGKSPVTWKANLIFVAGDVVTIEN